MFGRSSARAALKAELAGDLAGAIQGWMEAGRPDEAARVMLLRGDAELDGRARMQHYLQAFQAAPEGSKVRDDAKRKKATLVVSLFASGALSGAAKRDLLDAAKTLEELKDGTAADAYRLAGDREGEARVFAALGEVDKLESLLFEDNTRAKSARDREATHAEIELLSRSGDRRAALALAERLVAVHTEDRTAAERADSLRARRVTGPVVRLRVRGAGVALVLGPEITIGRTEGTLQIASSSVSRVHARITREEGRAVLKDAGSRNGTHLRGMRVAGAIAIDAGIDVTLGHDVPLGLRPSPEWPGAIRIDIAGGTYVAPLGDVAVPGTGWTLEVSPGAGSSSAPWLELVTHGEPAFAGNVSMAERITLLVGDAFSSARGAPPILEITAT